MTINNNKFIAKNGLDAGGDITATGTITGGNIISNVGGSTGLGIASLSVTTGVYNVAVGYSAMAGNTTGVYNVVVGAFALNANNGAENTVIGYNAMTSATGASSNTAMGSSALSSNLISNNNTAIGYQALNLTTGNTNTALGFQAGAALTTGSNNTILGSYSAASFATSSYQVLISDGGGNLRMNINQNGAVSFNDTTSFGNNNDVLVSTSSSSKPIWKPFTSLVTSGGSSVNTNSVKIRRGTGCFFIQTADNRIFSWGNNGWGQLGQGSPNAKELVSEVQFPTKLTGISISKFEVISNTVYVLFSNGDLYGWGSNYSGQLGNGTTTEGWMATKIASSVATFYNPFPGSDCTRANATTVGQGSIWYKTTGGAFYRCGDNGAGNLGNAGTANVSTPILYTPISGNTIDNIFLSDVNLSNTFIKQHNGATYTLYATGTNSDGQLGINSTTATTGFTNVGAASTVLTSALISGIVDIQSGGYNWNGTTATSNGFTVIWTIDPANGLHKIYTAGNNTNGQLGWNAGASSNVFGLAYTAPVGVTITKMVRSYQNVFLVLSNGAWVGWGDSVYGQLNGTTVDVLSPQTTPPISAGYPCTNIWADTKFYNGSQIMVYFYYPNGYSSTISSVLAVKGYNASGIGGIGNNSINAQITSFIGFPNINTFGNDIDTICVTGPTASSTATALISFTNSGRLLFAGDSNDYESNTTLTTAKYGFNTLQLGNVLGQ
jgi:alpha-tubulin suppressor-like RCC1 family protein